MRELVFKSAPPAMGGVFDFADLGLKAHHRPIDSFAIIGAERRAGEIMAQLDDDRDGLADLGVDTAPLLNRFDRAGLASFLYHAELWGCVVTGIEVEGVKAKMALGEVYVMLAAAPPLGPPVLLAWQRHVDAAIEAGAGTLALVEAAGSA